METSHDCFFRFTIWIFSIAYMASPRKIQNEANWSYVFIKIKMSLSSQFNQGYLCKIFPDFPYLKVFTTCKILVYYESMT